jgi:ribonuclease P protein component
MLSVVPGKSFPMNPLSRQASRQQDHETADVSTGLRRRSLAGVRLRRHADFQRAYAAARKRQSASMSWFLAPQSTAEPQPASPRVGLTVGKVLGKSHDRNRIKRRMREALRRHVDLLPAGCDLILHPRRAVLTLEFARLEAEIVRILEQARSEIVRGSLQPSPSEPSS